MPKWKESGWLDVLGITCVQLAGCLCSYFTVNLIISVPDSFSQELLYRLIPLPNSRDIDV